MPLRHLKSAELNKIAAFIAAFFIARLIGRVPFGETLICHQCRDVWGDPRLPTAAKESGRRTEFDTYDASESAPRPRAPVSMAGWRRVGRLGSAGVVAEIGAWAGSRSEMLGTKDLHETAARTTYSPAPI